MEPLKEWICDTCGGVIQSPEQGWLEWLKLEADNGSYLASGFRIVHHFLYSPNKKSKEGCYQHGPIAASMHLNEYTGADGLNYLLEMLRGGGSGREIAVANLDEFIEIVRRLQIPHYEEARRYQSSIDLRRGFQADLREIINEHEPEE